MVKKRDHVASEIWQTNIWFNIEKEIIAQVSGHAIQDIPYKPLSS